MTSLRFTEWRLGVILAAALLACSDPSPGSVSASGVWMNTGPVLFLVVQLEQTDDRLSGTGRVLTERLRTGTAGGTFDGDSIAISLSLVEFGRDGEEAWGFHGRTVSRNEISGKLFGPNAVIPGGVRELTIRRQ